MKDFKIYFSEVPAHGVHSMEVVRQSFDLIVPGATVSIEPIGSRNYLRIKDGKGAIIFYADFADVLYVQELNENPIKLSRVKVDSKLK